MSVFSIFSKIFIGKNPFKFSTIYNRFSKTPQIGTWSVILNIKCYDLCASLQRIMGYFQASRSLKTRTPKNRHRCPKKKIFIILISASRAIESKDDKTKSSVVENGDGTGISISQIIDLIAVPIFSATEARTGDFEVGANLHADCAIKRKDAGDKSPYRKRKRTPARPIKGNRFLKTTK